MIQNDFSIVAQNISCALYVINLFLYGYLVLVLMEVLICKDAKSSKILHRPVKVRIRLFKRSLRSLFYRASFGVFIASFIAILTLIHQLWSTQPKKFEWVAFHNLMTLSLIYLYHYWGYNATFFTKFKLFLKGELN